PEVPAPARFRIYNGYDLFGGDFARSKKGMWLTQSECQSMCASQSRCRAFTYNTKYGVCFLKDRVSGKLKPWKTAISGILSSARQPVAVDSGSIGNQTVSSSGACGSGFKTRTNTDYFGNDIGGYRGSFSSCRRRCRNTSRCRGFSWIKKRNVSKRCWLKRAMRNPSYKSNVLSCVKS
ncbi:MAG TPA: hypothetical protein ENJ55_05020, partial [Rhizobiales bacterium]|nr:hypothetical protein [Hyphomicrobiales bacterium]